VGVDWRELVQIESWDLVTSYNGVVSAKLINDLKPLSKCTSIYIDNIKS